MPRRGNTVATCADCGELFEQRSDIGKPFTKCLDCRVVQLTGRELRERDQAVAGRGFDEGHRAGYLAGHHAAVDVLEMLELEMGPEHAIAELKRFHLHELRPQLEAGERDVPQLWTIGDVVSEVLDDPLYEDRPYERVEPILRAYWSRVAGVGRPFEGNIRARMRAIWERGGAKVAS